MVFECFFFGGLWGGCWGVLVCLGSCAFCCFSIIAGWFFSGLLGFHLSVWVKLGSMVVHLAKLGLQKGLCISGVFFVSDAKRAAERSALSGKSGRPG